MRVKRARLGVAASLALIGGLLPLTAAVAVPSSPPTITSVTAGGVRMTTSPAAGKTSVPIVEVGGVVAGNNVTLAYAYGSTAGTVSCVVPVGQTVARFNDSLSCSLVTSNFALPEDGDWVFQANASDSVTDPVTTDWSTPFNYIRDNDDPAAPREPTTVTKLAGADIAFTFKPSLGDAPGPVPSGVDHYQILRQDQADTSTFPVIGSVAASTCSDPSTATCSYTDTTSEDGHTYKYAARSIDRAGNQSGGFQNENPISGPITADGAGPSPAPNAPTVTPDGTGFLAGYGTDPTPKIEVTNASTESVSVQLFTQVGTDALVALGSPQAAGPGATVDWNNGSSDPQVATISTDRAYTITAVAYDSLGNGTTSPGTPYTLDRVAPAAPSIDSINGQTTTSTSGNDTTPQVAVGGVANLDRVFLTVQDANNTPPPETYERSSSGSTLTYNRTGDPADFTLTGPDRTVNLTATTVDPAGNSSSPSASKTYALDTTAPTQPVIDAVEGDAASPANERDRTPTVAGTIAADTVKVELYDGSNKVAERTTAAVTSVTFNAAESDSDFIVAWGEHTLTLKALDTAGNVATSVAYTLNTIDNGVPTTPEPTAKLISGAPSRVFVDWADSSDQAGAGTDGYTSPPITYDLLRGVADPDSEGVCPPASGVTFTSFQTDLTTSEYTDQPTSAEVGKCLYYKGKAADAVNNESPLSSSTAGVKVASTQNPARPSITSVAGDTSSPAFGTGSGADKPEVVVAVEETGGTVKLLSDGAVVAEKSATGSTVTFGTADYSVGIAPRKHTLTIQHESGPRISAPSEPFTYSRPPNAPTVTSVAGDTNGSPAKSTDKKPVVNVSGVQVGDTVTLYADGAQVARVTAASGGTASFTVTDWTGELSAMQEYILTVTTCDPNIGSCSTVPEATSPASANYVYERAAVIKGFELDGYGGLHPINGNERVTDGPYWPGWDIARDVVLHPTDPTKGWILDGWGGVHSFGGAPKITSGTYWPGWDIARDLVLLPGSTSSGYVLDGWGGLHRFGGAPSLGAGPYFRFDIARQLVLHPTDPTKGWVLDGWGGIHALGTTPAAAGGPYWPGWDVASSLVIRPPSTWSNPNSPQGYVLDGYGGVHSVGGAPVATTSSYTPNDSRARRMVLTEPDGTGGYFVTSRGNTPHFGDALSMPAPATFSFAIGRSLAVIAS